VLPGGENTIVISAGANALLSADKVRRAITQTTPAFVLCQLEIPLECTVAALREARAQGARTVLDPAPARPLPNDLLSCVDYLTPNQSEAVALLGRPGESIDNPQDAARAASGLLQLGVGTVILKLGAQGCLIADRAGSVHIPGHPVRAVDTTGAGDTFSGALAVALAEGRSTVEAATFANGAAALSVTRRGAQTSIPFRAEVDELLSGCNLGVAAG
jgi:ribokinase